MVEDDKVVLETYEDDDEWTLEKFASNSSLCNLERILTKGRSVLGEFQFASTKYGKGEIHPRVFSGCL